MVHPKSCLDASSATMLSWKHKLHLFQAQQSLSQRWHQTQAPERSSCKVEKGSLLFTKFSFFLQVQVEVLPELILKQVVVQVPFSSIPGFWGAPLGLCHCREDSVGIFALEKRSH